ncbi:MAG TPA: magnesium chelatase, partial [Anaerolineae bacterium]|nr:magnesium chelatase [Anaerolineae bacterium]
AILDASAQGHYTVRRGPMAATYRARLMLIGSMNPEEGALRPQIQDRFGLRVLVRGATDLDERMEIYRRSVLYKNKPYRFTTTWLAETEAAREEVAEARKRLSKVTLSAQVEREALRWIQALKIDSHRAELTLFEAGRALAAADSRLEVTLDDLRTIAPLALRQRQTETAQTYFKAQEKEDKRIKEIVGREPKVRSNQSRAKKTAEEKMAVDNSPQAVTDNSPDQAANANSKGGDKSKSSASVTKE